MRYPEFLSEGGTIGFVAPSFGCATEPYKTAFGMTIKRFEKEGYTVELGPNCYEDNGIGISNTPQECGKELTQMYESNVNDVLISCGGGELMCEILPYVDFDRIKAAKPKWYLGYSDNTNFTFLQNTIADTASVYGPCAGAFAMKDWHQALVDTFDVLRGKGCKNNNGVVEKQVHGYDTWERESLKNEENPAPQYNLTEKKILRKYVGGDECDTEIAFEGRLVGGCMDCYSKYVVELEDSGRVRAYFPLKEEISATQWIGGVIIISPMYELDICSGEKFVDFLHRAMLETELEQPVYAWHIADFDLPGKEFTAGSRLVRL